MQRMTLKQAQKLRKQSIQAALRDSVADKIRYLCTADPSGIDIDPNDVSADPSDANAVPSVNTRPLAGAGVILKYYRKQHTATAEVADRPGKLVFRAHLTDTLAWNVIVYRYGTWVGKLSNEYSRVSFRKNHSEVVKIHDNFGPLGDDENA